MLLLMLSTLICLLISTRSAMAADAPLFREDFRTGVDDRWSRRVSEDTSFELSGGWLLLEAGENTLCHVQRPLDADEVTVTVRIGWYGSVYAAWDDRNWCGVGKISPTPFGRFYSTCTTGGETIETDHRGCHAGSHHFVRVQIGRDCIRFLYSNDGAEWIRLRAIERPAGFAGAPALVALGKHYGPGRRPFIEQGAEPAPAERGVRYAAHFSQFSVERTPPDALRMTSAERRLLGETGVDTVGLALLRGSQDPTFEAVAKCYPAMKYAREVVGVPEHPLDIGVDWLGRMDVSPWAPPLAWIRSDESLLPFVEAKQPLTRRLLDGYLPVITLTTSHAGVSYEQTVFGWSEGVKAESDLFAYVRLRVRAKSGASLPKQVSLCYEHGSKCRTWDLPQNPGGSAELCIRFKYPEPGSASVVNAEDFSSRLNEVADHWRQRISLAERFDVPDRRVSEAYRAWLVYSMLNADTVNGYCEPHDGAGFYEEIFGYSVTLHTMALDMYGLHDYARRILDTLMHFQQPDGLYVQACGLPDHGTFLLALASHYSMTRDDAWLRRVAPSILRACEWAVRQRDAAPRDGVTRGLIKFRPYNDYPQPVFNYQGNSHLCVGLQAAAEALRAAGMVKEADRFAYEAVRYRKDILDSMDAAAFADGGLTVLPMEPDTHRILKLSRYRGGDYYGLVASMILETGFLPAGDKRATWVTEMLESRQGLVAGLCEFMEGIDHAYTYGYLMTQMERDDVRKVILGFWSMLAYGMTRDTYSPVEISQIMTGENHLTLPHLYSCTQQLRLLRNMLIWEDGDTLRIGHAIPREWLARGKRVSASAAPTRFGPVSFRITAGADSSMRVTIDPPLSSPPREIRVRLRHPNQAAIDSVRATPSLPVRVDGEDIVLGRLSGSVELRVNFRGR